MVVETADDVALVASDADVWVADTATTTHVAREKRVFHTYTPVTGRTLQGAGRTPILGRGTVKIALKLDGRESIIELRDVIHAPGVLHNLISIG